MPRLEEDRAGFLERLRARQPEIEAAIFACVCAVSGSEIEHADYQLERMIAQFAHEYRLEHHLTDPSPERHRAELVQRLLAGTLVDADELGYELDAWHLCVIATGANAQQAVRGLAVVLGRELLTVARDDEQVWAWLGGQRKLMVADVERVLSAQGLADVSLAIGEPARGINGWRLTHREAQAALLVARHSPQRLTRYLDVALEATALQDEALADSLIERYLLPLDGMRIGGEAARRTLRALFDTEYNVSSAAHPLKAHRSSVHRWREEIERRLGYRLHEHQAEIEVALRIEDLRAHHSAERSPSKRLD
jgi:GGDEF-like domain